MQRGNPSAVAATALQIVTRNLNNVIDINYYPVEQVRGRAQDNPATVSSTMRSVKRRCLLQARNSNFRHRPIGIGVQGFADLLMQLRLPFESKGAIELNREIFETIYYAAVSMSCELARTSLTQCCNFATLSYTSTMPLRRRIQVLRSPPTHVRLSAADGCCGL